MAPIRTLCAPNLVQHSPSSFLLAKAGSEPVPQGRAQGPQPLQRALQPSLRANHAELTLASKASGSIAGDR